MNTQSVSTIRCPDCGAENNAFVDKCWICGHPFGAEEELVPASLVEDGRRPKYGPGTTVAYVAAILLIIATVFVGIGLAANGRHSPEYPIGYVVIMGPLALMLSYVMVRGSRSTNHAFSATSALLTGLVFTLLAIPLMLLAVVIGLFVICIAALS